MKHADGRVDNTSIVERNKRKPVVVPGDLNWIARKRNDSRTSPPTPEYERAYQEINWNGKQRGVA